MKSQGVFEQPFVEYVDKALDRLWVRTKDNPAIPDESFRSVNVPAANLISEWTQVRACSHSALISGRGIVLAAR
jgi:hypothetical protein